MKFAFDSAAYADDPNALGLIAELFLRSQSTAAGISGGFVPTTPGWTRSSTVPDDVVATLCGDESDGSGAWVRHWTHDATDLEVAWSNDGGVSILVRRRREETSREVVEPGFAIVNHRGGRQGGWSNA